MEKTTQSNPRRMLLDLAQGRRSGYWVEVLHHADDGAAAYLLHTPAEQAAGKSWRDVPPMPRTWEAVQMHYKWATGNEAADAAALPQYDEKRTYTGAVADTRTMAALCKWARK